MRVTLEEIAKIVHGEIIGDKNVVITGFSSIQEAKEGELTFVSNAKYIFYTKKTKASAILTPRDIEVAGKSIVRTDNPSLAFAQVLSRFGQNGIQPFAGIHKTAIIGDDVKLGKDITIGPYSVIERESIIGDYTIIHGGCYVGYQSQIGKKCVVYPHVTIRERTQIGHQVIIHSGAVIGADGFGFEQIKGEHQKIPQLGIVVVEDNVEIGANVTIDRARFEKTTIGRGTKIDNLVQIGHNVSLGENCIIAAQVGISGSTSVGKGTIIAGQAGLTGHIKVGENSIIAGQTGVTKSLPAHSKVSGYPAKQHHIAKRISASVQRLPHYVKVIHELKKKIEDLENKLNKK